MASEIRVEYPGAHYHVYDRGIEKRNIFEDEQDKYYFLKICDELHKPFGLIAHSYCLMNNHYHIFLETPKGNLSEILHRLNTRYAKYFNNKYDRVGYLFQNRFQAKLVETEVYGLTLSKYIHQNPIKDGFVNELDDWKWSSYLAFSGEEEPRDFLKTEKLLSLIEDGKVGTFKKYTQNNEEINLDELLIENFILGSQEFASKIKSEFLEFDDYGFFSNEDIHKKLKLKIESLEITWSLKRKLLLLGLSMNTSYSSRKIAELTGNKKPATVRKNISRLKKEVLTNKQLKKYIGIIQEI